MFDNKIADKITKILTILQQNNSETVTNKVKYLGQKITFE